MELNYPLVFSFLFIIFAAFYLLRGKTSGAAGNKASGGSATFVNNFSTDLTALAREDKLDPVIGRDKEIKKVVQVLSRRRKNNIIIFGKAGIGKTAIAEGLAIAIAQGLVPKNLADKIVLKIELSSVLAGTKYRGEFEKRFKSLIDNVISMDKRIIVFMDEIHTIVQAGGTEGSVDADDIIKAPLARGELQMIGTTTTEEYKKYIEPDKTLTRRFEGYLMKEPDKKTTVKMLEALKKNYEEYHRVSIGSDIIKQIVEGTAKIKDRSFPDKAIDILDEVCAQVRLNNSDSEKIIKVTSKDLKEAIKEYHNY
ncbi:MAG: ATP-dependent Clp protease ATP-binding subunit [Candidatus Komeilibacteria bacterium]|jgi:ATP-dependent Clp protease ATP-binding subunit ClpC|nr:ATP-dependent Clp protease ATP-binding subunit [Candidatus Komeilibacteria bacterium]MBT4447394.1 ATP-dependent Clp protease ATP-binding subunit [Candidatus Komeilibacteria bacterium]